MQINKFKDNIFELRTETQFNQLALDLFKFQSQNNPVYASFIKLLKIDPDNINNILDIPFMPISFFKEHSVTCFPYSQPTYTFTSSGTTGTTTSKHNIYDINIYEQSFSKCFELFYGSISDYCILALLPSYLERQGSSLIYMVEKLINDANHPMSGFYLDDFEALNKRLIALELSGQKSILIGVSFALLDFCEKHSPSLKNTIVMETGGMKGKRKEIIRKELHEGLQSAFNLKNIHSEYGMTELLSQAYSTENQTFECPPWMKVLIRDTTDPFHLLPNNHTGGINVIDLANIESCAFIATQDLGKKISPKQFEVLGRFDNSDIRGCNLMAQ